MGMILCGTLRTLTLSGRVIQGFIKMLLFKQPHLRGIMIFTEKREREMKEILLKSQH